jgi:signal peptidase I
MAPTLRADQRVEVATLGATDQVRRGDIIVFSNPDVEARPAKDLVERVIGLPRERIEGRDGHVYINGKRLEEPYLATSTVTSTFSAQEIPEGAVWVMGDNRPASRDSRYYGPIQVSSILGTIKV